MLQSNHKDHSCASQRGERKFVHDRDDSSGVSDGALEKKTRTMHARTHTHIYGAAVVALVNDNDDEDCVS
uniref:Uncharacterized protein n=1 Tax=Trichogramma kaykai TaxID=54128 RepID=A0ABD2WCM7_9HYME